MKAIAIAPAYLSAFPEELHAQTRERLVVHELATNAAKYGALSRPKGRVEIAWSVEGGRLALTWRERGGPKAAEPASRGFGLKMIEGEISHSLGGTAEMRFEPEGLVVQLSLPLERVLAKG